MFRPNTCVDQRASLPAGVLITDEDQDAVTRITSKQAVLCCEVSVSVESACPGCFRHHSPVSETGGSASSCEVVLLCLHRPQRKRPTVSCSVTLQTTELRCTATVRSRRGFIVYVRLKWSSSVAGMDVLYVANIRTFPVLGASSDSFDQE